jgi:hypothetical protein
MPRKAKAVKAQLQSSLYHLTGGVFTVTKGRMSVKITFYHIKSSFYVLFRQESPGKASEESML